MKTPSNGKSRRRASTRAALCVVMLVCALALCGGCASRVLATASSSAQMRDTEKERATRLRDKREIQAIYNAMATAQKRGDLKATLKFFAPDVQIVTDNGARLGFKDLKRVLALPAATMRLNVVKTSITGFARRGALADAKVTTHIEAASKKSRGAKAQHFVIETLRRERWRASGAGWRLIFSKTLGQITRAK